MKRLVASDTRVALTFGTVAAVLIAFINPGPDVAFLIAAAVTSIGLIFVLGPDWRESRRETHHHRGHSGRRNGRRR